MERKNSPFRFERVRNFGETYSHALEFIRGNFGPFFRTILFVAGPMVLLMGIIHTAISMRLLISITQDVDAFFGAISTQYISWYLTLSFSQLVLALVVSQYVRVYRKLGAGNFDAMDVVKSLFRTFWRNMISLFGIFILLALITAITSLLVFKLMSLDPGFAILIGFFSFVAIALLTPPAWYFFSSFFLVRALDQRQGFFRSIGTAFRVMRGNYWWSWSVMTVFFLILWGLSWMVDLPLKLIDIFLNLSTLDSSITMENKVYYVAIAMLLATFIKSIFQSSIYVVSAMHYFSLRERRDGAALLKLIDEIGTKQEDEIELYY